MDRELKFRGFDPVNNKMVFADIVECEEMDEWITWENPVGSPTNTGTRFEVMQFTGLKDKDGVDIYEDDIVSSELNCMISAGRANYVVGYLFDQFCVNGCSLFQNINHFDTKVVGNIHQNPELIEVDK